ncbi:MAG: rRNA maturation RNase YbeY [Verrucomicrobiota bacterium]|jgi:probable rRNA maturation factor
MNIVIANRQRVRKINLRLMKKITRELLANLELEKAEIGICLVGAPEMTRLNETFLHHAGSTDVIAFDYTTKVAQASRLPCPSNRQPSSSWDGCATLHGEIFICVDEAVRQARKFGTSWQSEVIRYLVHGVLHLIGFDDSSADARRRMKRVEGRLLGKLSRRFTLAQLFRPAKLTA